MAGKGAHGAEGLLYAGGDRRKEMLYVCKGERKQRDNRSTGVTEVNIGIRDDGMGADRPDGKAGETRKRSVSFC